MRWFRSRGRWLLGVVFLWVWGGVGHAVEGKIRVFDARVYAAPDKASEVLDRLAEGTAVSVDEEVKDGWRRIRLRDGASIGWIRADAVSVPGEPLPTLTPTAAPGGETGAAAPESGAATAGAEGAKADLPKTATVAQPVAPRPPTVLVRQPKRMMEFSDLEAATARDPFVGAQASELANQRVIAISVMVVSALVAVGGAVLVLTGGPSTDDIVRGRESDDTQSVAGWAMVGVGAVGWFGGYFFKPDDSDAIKVVNAWNERHIEEPLEWVVEPKTIIQQSTPSYQYQSPTTPSYQPTPTYRPR